MTARSKLAGEAMAVVLAGGRNRGRSLIAADCEVAELDRIADGPDSLRHLKETKRPPQCRKKRLALSRNFFLGAAEEWGSASGLPVRR